MKKYRILTLAFIVLMFPLGNIKAQEKTNHDILKEYKQWSSIRDDWANLARYQKANEKLKEIGEGQNRVVFMGNSITDAWIQVSPEFFEGKPYIDRGISGQTTPQMLVRFRQDVLDLKPKVVVILAGTNDIAGNTGPSTLEMIEGNIASMAELAKANGIKVILASILPAFDYPWKPGLEPAPKIIAINKWMKSYTEDNEFYYLDYFSSMADERNGLQKDLTYDGVHPNKDGYLVMEKLVEKAISVAVTK